MSQAPWTLDYSDCLSKLQTPLSVCPATLVVETFDFVRLKMVSKKVILGKLLLFPSATHHTTRHFSVSLHAWFTSYIAGLGLLGTVRMIEWFFDAPSLPRLLVVIGSLNS